MKVMIDKNYFNKRLLLLIPLVAMVIFGIFLLSYGVREFSYVIQQIIYSIIMTGGIWVGCMVIVMYLWRKFPWEQNPLKHLFIEIFAIFLYTLAYSYLVFRLIGNKLHFAETEDIPIQIFITLLITYLITAIHESVFFYQQWKYNFSKSALLERDNMEARYEALRSQINPHFLFNSLNSLSNLVDKNEKAVNYIQDLSDMLRYMLKSNEKELVLLRDEILVLKNYVNLQKMRFNESLKISIDVPESFFHYALPPLSLQMLVENAIKHNVITEENPLRVRIQAEKDSVFVENNLQKKEVLESTKQGLKNINGRYRLFTTRGVKIVENSQSFKVILPLLEVEL